MKLGKKVVALVMLAGSMGSAGCNVAREDESGAVAAPGSSAGQTNAPVPETDLDRYRISFIQSGGFLGVHDEIDVDATTRQITLQRGTSKTARLTPGEFASITDAIARANIPGAGGPYRCVGCADILLYDVVLDVGTSHNSVHWEEGSSAPRALFDLGKTLNDVAAIHFQSR
jgi:hypothetical protein